MDVEHSLLSMVPRQKRIRRHADFAKCVKCQKATKKRSRKAKSDGIQKLINASKLRRDEVYERISLDFERISSQQQSIVWHQNCYQSYTSKHNLEPFMKNDQENFVTPPSDDEEMQIRTGSAAPILD